MMRIAKYQYALYVNCTRRQDDQLYIWQQMSIMWKCVMENIVIYGCTETIQVVIHVLLNEHTARENVYTYVYMYKFTHTP